MSRLLWFTVYIVSYRVTDLYHRGSYGTKWTNLSAVVDGVTVYNQPHYSDFNLSILNESFCIGLKDK